MSDSQTQRYTRKVILDKYKIDIGADVLSIILNYNCRKMDMAVVVS
eukprot:UN14375